MGDRRNIIIKGNGMGIALYTHWTGSEAMEDIAIALDNGRSRWNDFGYFVRIMFDTMARLDLRDGTTGYGIYPLGDDGNSPMEPTPGYDPVINLDNQTVEVECNVYTFESIIEAHYDKVQAKPI